ncbi:hypothetical protein EsDP_00002589 [Epichloe bromicola]|uniref:Zn(2)-C6 fungal-type domain-containing protein n=1 Tax=Epichloe bromicola TaxID=79588 RepID=A0ABQ0CLA1_9HYPO
MGRRPNPLILEYFERGPKLNDNSNRYPHTCKQCGENFPKGRIDSLTTHITKRCPAISDSERMRACLELHGITYARSAAERHHQAQAAQAASQANGQQMSPSALPQGWSALETLAEASRQVDLNENSRGNKAQQQPDQAQAQAQAEDSSAQNAERFELQEQYTLDNPPASYETSRSQINGKKSSVAFQTPPPTVTELSPEERLQALLPASETSPDAANISVAVAAAARLNPSLLDPQLVDGDTTPTSPSVADSTVAAAANEGTPNMAVDNSASQPWGEMTYLTSTSPAPLLDENPPLPPLPMNRGGVRMDTSAGVLNGRTRHFRSKFTPARRQEVKEVRKLGACIRCRILRKICSKGTPCDTCRKVLSPRVWMTGCVRSRLHEQLDLYSAGVQVVLSQNRINLLKEQLKLINNGSVVEVSHFAEAGKNIVLAAVVAVLQALQQADIVSTESQGALHQVIMIDQDKDDVPGKIEMYMRDVLDLFIEREPSKFMRITLETAKEQLAESENEILRKALELWGLVESIDRERQWSIVEKPSADAEQGRPIKEAENDNDADTYTMMCMQLNAAAERKANNTSKALLNLMDRQLADSKTKVGFHIYLTALIFLNCVEKSTWAFKAWEQDHLRPGWPLERDPSVFTQQGGNLAGLIKMLLGIRKALPQTCRDAQGRLSTQDQDPAVVKYFLSLDMEYDTIEARQRGSQFSPADSRSLELMFCSHLLLPNAPG